MSINVELNTLGFESVTASKEIRSFSEDKKNKILEEIISSCLLYTSDAADDMQ